MTDLNALPLPDLYAELAGTGLITRLIELARDEDLGERWQQGDVTSRAFVPGYIRGTARIVARQGGVVAGLACVPEVLHVFQADVDAHVLRPDGSTVAPGETIASLSGSLQAVFTAERTVLNLLGRLSGVATRAAAFVAAAAGGGGSARVFDTRKTTPGLRLLEKYAVRCGGACCHRLGLYDAVMIKDNHLAAVRVAPSAGESGFAAAVRHAAQRARDEAGRAGLRFVVLEVDRPDQLKPILDAGGCGIDIALLDNMSLENLRRCVAMRDSSAARSMHLEASGGVTLQSIASIAASGVDRVSVGSLTHGATWLDIGLDMDESPPVRS